MQLLFIRYLVDDFAALPTIHDSKHTYISKHSVDTPPNFLPSEFPCPQLQTESLSHLNSERSTDHPYPATDNPPAGTFTAKQRYDRPLCWVANLSNVSGQTIQESIRTRQARCGSGVAMRIWRFFGGEVTTQDTSLQLCFSVRD